MVYTYKIIGQSDCYLLAEGLTGGLAEGLAEGLGTRLSKTLGDNVYVHTSHALGFLLEKLPSLTHHGSTELYLATKHTSDYQ